MALQTLSWQRFFFFRCYKTFQIQLWILLKCWNWSPGSDQYTQGTLSNCTKDFCWSQGWSLSGLSQRSFMGQNLWNHELHDFRKPDRIRCCGWSILRCDRHQYHHHPLLHVWTDCPRKVKKQGTCTGTPQTGGIVFFLYVINLYFYLFVIKLYFYLCLIRLWFYFLIKLYFYLFLIKLYFFCSWLNFILLKINFYYLDGGVYFLVFYRPLRWCESIGIWEEVRSASRYARRRKYNMK